LCDRNGESMSEIVGRRVRLASQPRKSGLPDDWPEDWVRTQHRLSVRGGMKFVNLSLAGRSHA
jgi:hypothetical protein